MSLLTAKLADDLFLRQLDDLLNSALDALGPGAFAWLGFDLLYATREQRWLVIEANPRLTTSFAGLAVASGHGLMDRVLRACSGKSITWMDLGTQLNFRSDGCQSYRGNFGC